MVAHAPRSQAWILGVLVGAVAILFVLWRAIGISSTNTRSLDAPVPVETVDTDATASGAPPVDLQRPVQERSAPPKDPKIRLHGTLFNARDRNPIASACSLRAVDEAWDEHSLSSSGDGSYEFVDLHPGPWEIEVRESTFQTMRVPIDLREDEPDKTLDLFLRPALSIRVRIEGAAGEDLQMTAGNGYLQIGGLREDVRRAAATPAERLVARGFPVPFGLTVLATRVAPARWLRADGEPDAGVGRFVTRGFTRRPGEQDVRNLRLPDGTALGELPPNVCGVLELSEPPPVFASLVVHDFVLRTVPVPLGADEITFSITRAELKALPGSVRLRVVDALDGLLPRNLELRIDERPLLAEPWTSLDRDGSITLTNLLPGWANLTISVPERESIAERILVQPGVQTDLGTYRTQPLSLAEIRARVLDEQDAPAKVQFNVFPLERYEAVHEVLARRIFRSTAEGDLTIDSFGPGRYLIVANEPGWISVPVLADTTFRRRVQVEIRVAKGTSVALRLRADPPPDAHLSIQTSTGLPVADSKCRNGVTMRFHLAPGNYSAELRDGDTWLWSESLAVGGEPVRRYLPR